MERLYCTYTNEDVLIFIGNTNRNKMLVIRERDFELNQEVEKDYIIFCYTPTYEIINNGYRFLYDVSVEEDLSNLILYYDENGVLKEFGVNKDNLYTPIYINYSIEKIRQHAEELVDDIGKVFESYLEENFRNNELYLCGLFYFYDGEAIDINLTMGTEEERTKLRDSNYDTEHLANYSLRANLEGPVQNKLYTLIQSIAKDEKAEEHELLEYIVHKVDDRMKNLDWSNKVNISDKFTYLEAERYD